MLHNADPEMLNFMFAVITGLL